MIKFAVAGLALGVLLAVSSIISLAVPWVCAILTLKVQEVKQSIHALKTLNKLNSFIFLGVFR